MIAMNKWNSEFTRQCIKQKNIAVQKLGFSDGASEYNYIKRKVVLLGKNSRINDKRIYVSVQCIFK